MSVHVTSKELALFLDAVANAPMTLRQAHALKATTERLCELASGDKLIGVVSVTEPVGRASLTSSD